MKNNFFSLSHFFNWNYKMMKFTALQLNLVIMRAISIKTIIFNIVTNVFIFEYFWERLFQYHPLNELLFILFQTKPILMRGSAPVFQVSLRFTDVLSRFNEVKSINLFFMFLHYFLKKINGKVQISLMK